MTTTLFAEPTQAESTRPDGARTAPGAPEPGVVERACADALDRIADADVSLAIWRRAAVAGVERELAWHEPGLTTPLRRQLAAAALALDAADALATPLAEAGLSPDTHPCWLADMAALAQRFGALLAARLGDVGVTLRLEALSDVACPRFHVDQTRLRLLCSYRGPGTLWLPPAAVNRQALAAGGNNDAIADPLRVQQLAPFWVGIFKGERYPGNAGRGQVHRSPPVADGEPPRLLFCLDA